MVSPSGTILSFNNAANTFLGLGKADPTGVSLFDCFSGEKREHLQQEFFSCCEIGRTTHCRESFGNQIYDFDLYPVSENGDKTVTAVAFFSHDVTKRLLAEGKQRQSQKMEALVRLSGGVAHDFNNMLHVVLGYSALLRDHVGDDARAGEMLTAIYEASTRAQSLVKALQAFAQSARGAAEPVDVVQSVREVVSVLKSQCGSAIKVTIDTSPSMRLIMADKSEVSRALTNVCDNARESVGDSSGEIDILINSKRFDHDEDELAKGDYTVVSVVDSGRGVERSDLTRVYDPFFTTKNRRGAHGLGLTTVYAIMRRNGGGVRIRNEKEKGARVDLYWPVAPVGSSVREAGVYRAEEPAGYKEERERRETILFVEDEEMLRTLACYTLEEAGYEVLTASDGVEGLASYNKRKGEIRMGILDVMMPRMNGRELFDALREQDPDFPVLFCSGFSGEQLAADQLSGVSCDFLRKPYQSADLLRAVSVMLKKTRTPTRTE